MTATVPNPATLRDVADKNPAPAPTSGNVPDAVDRLCEYDPGGQTGCRRTQTILALEAEYDTFVHPEMFWGYWDQFCQHEGNTYYYKDWLETNVQRDQTALASDSANSALTPHLNVVTTFLGNDIHTECLHAMCNQLTNTSEANNSESLLE